jgi:anaerobic ribonucleoside-triphosphate reductase activating protein
MDMKLLNVAAICHKTRALGPGLRAVIWVQGCPFRCKGCISPSWIPIQPAMEYHPQELADTLLADPEITGLTISGGEPVLQASALDSLLSYARTKREIDVIMFSGYYYENLLAFPEGSAVARLLGNIDVLIDGPYDEKHNDNRGMRGSTNQRVFNLTQKLIGTNFESYTRQVEIHVSDGELLFVGVPPAGVVPGVLTTVDNHTGKCYPGYAYERA